MQKIYFLLPLLFTFISVSAQIEGSHDGHGHTAPLADAENAGVEQCAHTTIHERLMSESPTYRLEQEAREASLMEKVEQYKNGSIPKNDAILTIPVVVHIIHDGSAYGDGSNITDEQVYSAINALNQDYRKDGGHYGRWRR